MRLNLDRFALLPCWRSLAGPQTKFLALHFARFGRIFFRLLMGGAHAVRAKAYAGHALSDTLSSQMRSGA